MGDLQAVTVGDQAGDQPSRRPAGHTQAAQRASPTQRPVSQLFLWPRSRKGGLGATGRGCISHQPRPGPAGPGPPSRVEASPPFCSPLTIVGLLGPASSLVTLRPPKDTPHLPPPAPWPRGHTPRDPGLGFLRSQALVWRPVTLPESMGETERVALSPHRSQRQAGQGPEFGDWGGDRCPPAEHPSLLLHLDPVPCPLSPQVPPCRHLLQRRTGRPGSPAAAPCPARGLPGEGLPARRGPGPSSTMLESGSSPGSCQASQ